MITKKFLRSSDNLLKQTVHVTAEDQKDLLYLLYSVSKQADLKNIIDKALPQEPFALQKRKRKSETKLTKLQMATLISSNYFKKSQTTKRSASFTPQSTPSTPLKQRTIKSFFSPQVKQINIQSTPKSNLSVLSDENNNNINCNFLLPNLVQKSVGDCISLTTFSRNLFKLIHHLFFLSPWQDASVLVMTNLSKIQFTPEVELHSINSLDKNSGIFETRKQFIDYQHSLFLEMELNYALHKLRPSIQNSVQYTQPLSTGNQWGLNIDEVQNLNLFDDSFLIRYNYNWQCHEESSAQHTLIRILHHCCLYLFSNEYDDSLDPYRNILPLPQPLSVQLQAMIASQNSSLESIKNILPKRSQSQPFLINKENEKNSSPSPLTQSNTEITNQQKETKIKSEITSNDNHPIKNEKLDNDIENVKQQMDDSENKLKKNLNHSWTDRFRSEWIMARILTHGINELEKQKDYNSCACMYRLLLGCGKWGITRRGQWWERLSLILQSHLKNHSFSLNIALLGLEDPLIPDICPERISLMKRVSRLYKPPLRWGSPPDFPVILEATKKYFSGDLLSSSVGKKNKWKPLIFKIQNQNQNQNENSDSSLNDVSVIFPISVEQLALQYYQLQGWDGIHCEGGIIYPLFAMLLYSVLFAEIPKVFQSRFQGKNLFLFV